MALASVTLNYADQKASLVTFVLPGPNRKKIFVLLFIIKPIVMNDLFLLSPHVNDIGMTHIYRKTHSSK